MALQPLPKELQIALEKGRTDPVLFAETFLGVTLHKGQKRYLRETVKRKTRINILSCANRWGKSVTISILQIWYHFYKFGLNTHNREDWMKAEYRTANIAPHSALTEPVFKTMDAILTSKFTVRDQEGRTVTNKCLIEWFYIKERTLNTAPYRQHFAFNSYIEHKSLGGDQGDALQGKPYGIITYDEASRSDHLETEMNDSILARLMDWGGPLHLLSTPSVNSHSTLYYYDLYQKGLVGMNNSYTQTGPIDENTFFTPEQIQAQKDLFENNPLKEQVLEGKFIFGGNTLFDIESILAAKEPELNSGVRRQDGHRYIVAIDTAIGSDEMVYVVLDVTTKPYKLVRMMAAKGSSKSPQLHLNDFIDLVEAYYEDNNLTLILETFNGESVRFYQDMPGWIQSLTRCYGSWKPDRTKTDNQNPTRSRTGDVKKADMLIALRKLLSARELKIPEDEKLVQQLSIYKEKDDKIPTDRVIALALAAFLSEEQQVKEIEWHTLEW